MEVIVPDRSKAPAITGFPLLSLPEIKGITLDNGVRLNIIDAGEEEVCRTALLWPAGQAEALHPGAIGMALSLLSEGSSQMSGAEINGILEENGAWLKTADTFHTSTVLLHSLNSTADKVFPLLASIIDTPTFPEESFLSIRNKNVASREVAERKPAYQATVAGRKGFYGEGHPLAREITSADIGALTRVEIVDLHRDTLMAARPEIFVSGRVTDSIIGLISSTLGRIQFGPGVEQNIKKPACLTEEIVLRKDMPGSLQTGIRIQYPAPGRLHPDYEALRMAAVALGGYFGSRLMSNIREDKGYTYGISAALSSLPEGGSVVISCECDNAYADAVLAETDKEIRRLASEPMSAEEMEIVRNVIVSQLAGTLDSPFYISGYFEMIRANRLPDDLFTRQFREVLAMTRERVMQAAARYLLEGQRVISLAGAL